MIEKKDLINILDAIYEKSNTKKIDEKIKKAASNFDSKKLMNLMIETQQDVMQEKGYDKMEGLFDYMEAVDKHIEDDKIHGKVLKIRKRFAQE